MPKLSEFAEAHREKARDRLEWALRCMDAEDYRNAELSTQVAKDHLELADRLEDRAD